MNQHPSHRASWYCVWEEDWRVYPGSVNSRDCSRVTYPRSELRSYPMTLETQARCYRLCWWVSFHATDAHFGVNVVLVAVTTFSVPWCFKYCYGNFSHLWRNIVIFHFQALKWWKFKAVTKISQSPSFSILPSSISMLHFLARYNDSHKYSI